jgi:hypothetical protein
MLVEGRILKCLGMNKKKMMEKGLGNMLILKIWIRVILKKKK